LGQICLVFLPNSKFMELSIPPFLIFCPMNEKILHSLFRKTIHQHRSNSFLGRPYQISAKNAKKSTNRKKNYSILITTFHIARLTKQTLNQTIPNFHPFSANRPFSVFSHPAKILFTLVATRDGRGSN
jgi:hypothetical protein